MAEYRPILATARTAARLLDMKEARFRELVRGGHLPAPRDFAGEERWCVDTLRRIASGEASEGLGEVKW
jgi:hypothetical protein